MERDNLYRARGEFVFTLEQRIKSKCKVHPQDKQALLELVQEEIRNYRNGLIDQLSTYDQLAQLVGAHKTSVYDYLQELPHQEWFFRTSVLKAFRIKVANEIIAGLSKEARREISKKGAIAANALYGNPRARDRLSELEHKEISKKGGLRTIEIYGSPLLQLTADQRKEFGRKGARTFTHEQRKAQGQAAKESLRKKNGFLIRDVVYRLWVRGASNNQMAEILKLTPQQIYHAKARIKESGDFDKNLKPKEQKTPDAKFHSFDQHMNTIFLRELLKARMVATTDRFWDRLNELGQIQDIKLPESFEDRVCFETFLVTRMYAEIAERDSKKGKKEYFERFIKGGMGVDVRWFKEKLMSYERSLLDAAKVRLLQH